MEVVISERLVVMKQQNGKWYERYSITPHPLGTMWTLWGISGIVSEPLGDYPTERDVEEAKNKLLAEDERRKSFIELRAAAITESRCTVMASATGAWIAVVTGAAAHVDAGAYAQLFAASPKLLAFAEAYLEALSDPTVSDGEVDALTLMEDQARAAVDEARGRV